MYQYFEKFLATLRKQGRYRKLQGLRQHDDTALLDFSTNDYLSLSTHPALLCAAHEAINLYGIGATGSRLLSGDYKIYEDFEKLIANTKKMPASLTFNTGFQANFSALSCLMDEKVLGQKPLVFFDKLNHASLYQAVFVSGASLHRYHHNDAQHLQALLKTYAADPRPKFIVSETVFGMDGDIAPLEALVELAREFGAFLYLDEAHATGVFGEHGYGLSTALNLENLPCAIMGTFSKGLGASGAYIACDSIVRDLLVNRAAGFIYSTAPSPIIVAAAMQAWLLVKNLKQERESLQNTGRYLRHALQQAGFLTGRSTTHIVPIILGRENVCLAVQERLAQHKIRVSCVRPPTVPPGSARLRVALTTKHSYEQIDTFVAVLKQTYASHKQEGPHPPSEGESSKAIPK